MRTLKIVHNERRKNMNEENKELIGEIENRQEQLSQEVLDNLSQKAEKDLANVQKFEYGIPAEDVEVVNILKSKLQESLKGLEENWAKTEEQINSNADKNNKLLAFFKEELAKRVATDTELADILKTQIAACEKAMQQDENYKTNYQLQVARLKDCVRRLEFKVNTDNGKAYVSDDVIAFAHLMMGQ